MTTTTTPLTQAPGFGLVLRILTAPFRAIGAGLVALADNSSHMRQVEKLHAISDAQLEAAGTTRTEQVQRIFASAGCV